MTKFQDPNERRKEMSYYNYEEFKKFISYEDNLRWKCVFEIFYYCGLRKGELKGLTRKDIYFDKEVLSVNKQITQLNNRTKFEFSDTKTKDSYEFELPQDALELMPYGIAGDLLKSDISSEYGRIYSDRYEMMLSRLDHRYNLGTFTIDNSVEI